MKNIILILCLALSTCSAVHAQNKIEAYVKPLTKFQLRALPDTFVVLKIEYYKKIFDRQKASDNLILSQEMLIKNKNHQIRILKQKNDLNMESQETYKEQVNLLNHKIKKITRQKKRTKLLAWLGPVGLVLGILIAR